MQALTFQLGNDLFALDIQSVREIIQHGPTTPVPLMPMFVRGVMNLRGAVVPVIDLNARFGRAPSMTGKKTCVVIFDTVQHGEHTELGLLVDAVNAVVDIPAEGFEHSPDFGTTVRREFIRGVGKLDGRFVILLDPDHALDIDEMAHRCERTQDLVPA